MSGCCSHSHGGQCGKCGHHKCGKLYYLIFAVTLCIIIVILILFVILVIWLVLRPTKPKFYLRDTLVIEFNLTCPPNILTSIFQVTVCSRNPNDRIGIYYNKLDVYAVYKNAQITIPTALPTGYQGHNDIIVWSPYVSGDGIPLAPYLAEALVQDENAGFLLIDVRIDGRLRWKVGSWISGHYHINVNCPAFLTCTNGKGTGDGGVLLKFPQISSCSVDV